MLSYNENTNILESVKLSNLKTIDIFTFDLKESYSTISRKYNITKYKVEKIYKKFSKN